MMMTTMPMLMMTDDYNDYDAAGDEGDDCEDDDADVEDDDAAGDCVDDAVDDDNDDDDDPTHEVKTISGDKNNRCDE